MQAHPACTAHFGASHSPPITWLPRNKDSITAVGARMQLLHRALELHTVMTNYRIAAQCPRVSLCYARGMFKRPRPPFGVELQPTARRLLCYSTCVP